MKVWQLTTGRTEEVATLVIPEADQTIGSMKRFGGDGSPLDWPSPPRLEARAGKGRRPRPLGDLGPFLPGALVLGEKAREALGPFLSRFGQLLQVDVDGTAHWFYNVTHVVSCIDSARSEQRAGGTIGREAFVEASVPVEASVFKDPVTARARIYINEPGRRVLETMATQANLQGLKFLRAGLEEPAS
jgi:hypothetical protein